VLCFPKQAPRSRIHVASHSNTKSALVERASYSGFGSDRDRGSSSLSHFAFRPLARFVMTSLPPPAPSLQGSPTSSPTLGPLASPSLDPAAYQRVLAENEAMRSAGSRLEQQLAEYKEEQARLSAELQQARMRASSPVGASSRMSVRLRGPPLALFGGANAFGFELTAWLRAVRQQFKWYGRDMFPDDESRIEYAALHLKDGALEWWQSIDQSEIKTWDEFVACLQRRYQPRLAADAARVRIAALKQRGTVSKLCSEMQQLLVYVPTMHLDDRLFFFKQALDAPIAAKVAEQHPESLEEAMEAAVQAEMYLGRSNSNGNQYGRSFFKPRSGGQGPATGGGSSAPMELSNINQAAADSSSSDAQPPTQEQLLALWAEAQGKDHALNAVFSRGGAKVPGISKEDYERCRRENRCLRCKQPGHVARDCNKPVSLKW